MPIACHQNLGLHVQKCALKVLAGAPLTLAQLHFTNGVNDVDQSLELASTALHIATGYYFDQYGEPYIQRMGFQHKGYLKPGGALVMKVCVGQRRTWLNDLVLLLHLLELVCSAGDVALFLHRHTAARSEGPC